MWFKTTASVTISKSNDRYSPIATQEIEFLSSESQTKFFDIISSQEFKDAVLSQMFKTAGDDLYSYKLEDLITRKTENLFVTQENVLDYIVGVEIYQEPCFFKKNDRVFIISDSISYPVGSGTVVRPCEGSPVMYVRWDCNNKTSLISKFDVTKEISDYEKGTI